MGVNRRVIFASLLAYAAMSFWPGHTAGFAGAQYDLRCGGASATRVSPLDCVSASAHVERTEKNGGKARERLHWVQATSSAGWSPRERHTAVALDNRLWVMGGWDHSNLSLCNDVWYSSDGVSWTEATHAAPWTVRRCHVSLVFDDRMWVLGGEDWFKDLLNDVWYSSDGVSWGRATAYAAWSPREFHQGLVFDNKMWIIGGLSYEKERLNDVWYSSDGKNWTQATDNAAWDICSGSTAVVFTDRMWVVDGYCDEWSFDGSVWSSTDGAAWTYEGNSGPHMNHTSVAFADNMWLIAGNYWGDDTNDVWYSSDGALWTRASPSPPWAARIRHATVAFDNKLWVLGGLAHSGKDEGKPSANDVWYAKTVGAEFNASPLSGAPPLAVQFTDESTWFADPITSWRWDFGDGTGGEEQSPSHTYALRGAYTVSLTVTSESGTDTETKANYIIVHGEMHDFHSADQDQDGVIRLSELLRMVQFFNTGTFHCATSPDATEDGCAPGPGDTSCALHDADYAPPDWTINMSELLRVIQLYQSGGYHPCAEGEDGFCPGGAGAAM